MSGRVVHRLESIHVAEHNAERFAVPAGVRDLRLESLEQTAPVEHAGQVVVARQAPRLGE